MIGPISQPVGTVGVAFGEGAGVGVVTTDALGVDADVASTTGIELDAAGIALPPPPPHPASEKARRTTGFATLPSWLVNMCLRAGVVGRQVDESCGSSRQALAPAGETSKRKRDPAAALHAAIAS